MIFIRAQADQKGSFAGLVPGVPVTPARELFLDGPDGRRKIEIELVEMVSLYELEGLSVLYVVFGKRVDVGGMDASGAPVRASLQGGDQVQSQQGQVVQVIGRQRLAIQMSVNQTKAAETPGPATHPANIGEHQMDRVSDDYAVNGARPRDQEPYLPVQLAGERTSMTRQLQGDDFMRRHLAPIGSFQ